MRQENNLVWIDLEMTGLNPAIDTILEVAVIITDKDLNVLAETPSLVINQPENVLEAMNEWCQKQHKKSGLVQAVQESTMTLLQAEQEVLALIQRYCYQRKSFLCGNSVWQDRAFLVQFMPCVIDYLHYKLIDVSSVQQLLRNWYPQSPFLEFKKTDQHRALPDIRESLEELKHYRKHFFI